MPNAANRQIEFGKKGKLNCGIATNCSTLKWCVFFLIAETSFFIVVI